jgi:hypothetical protein
MKRKLLFFVSLVLVLTGCEDLFEPAIQNNRSLEDVQNEPRFAQGLLINGYARIPTNAWTFSEMATDDAVANNESNAYSAIATGQWAANNNPLNQWTNSKAAIQYLNLMLTEVDNVRYSENAAVNQMFKDRLKGESYGLRALFMYYLLQAHGGMAGNEILGVPIVLEPEDIKSDFNQPRATFEECMQQLYSDAAKAIDLLPLDYGNISNSELIPDRYLSLAPQTDDYNRVFGNNARLLVSARIVRAVKAQAALLAASPAFGDGNTTTWSTAADFAAEIIDMNGGVAGLASDGATWFANIAQINAVAGGVNPPEILWRIDLGSPSSTLESQNYPPTLFGSGLVNPTQNLVNAFPMANGYPITDPASGYDPMNPYANRDPRLRQHIVVNGSTAGPGNTIINTAVDGGTNDGLNKVETSTRTGYYLRKLLRQDVNMNPSSVNGQLHLKPRIRYTELYLIYAEAANEAWGPMGTGSHSYSAYDVIRAIRQRAGIGLTNGDAYLESVKNDQVAMRALIRNERRLELSFEGFRFWDLRRWKENLTETAQGVRIASGQQEVLAVENRLYDEHMIYGPVPYSEILKFGALRQNNGW